MVNVVRLLDGRGPEVTLPDYWSVRDPTPPEWVDWFLEQSREAQLVIAAYHLETERNATATAVDDDGDDDPSF